MALFESRKPSSDPSAARRASAKRLRAKKRRLLTAMMMAEAARPVIGGQAVIEGVMMRSPKSFAVAVRRPDDSIVVREEPWLSFAERFPILKWPLLRGANMLIESMFNGLGALNFAASEAMAAAEEEEAKERGEDPADVEKKDSKLALAMTLAGSMFFAILLFKGVPHFTTWGIGNLLGENGHTALPIDGPLFHLIDGVIKLGIFITYILLLSRMPDVKRLFMYHGAEHMSVHTYEAREDLDVEHTRHRSTAHPRCGTTLILLVIAVSIVVFVAVIPLMPRVSDSDLVQTLFAFAIKVPLMLPIAGLAYEAQRLAAKRPDSPLVQAFIAPGMLMQKLTTRQPGDAELEVALTALRKTVWREELVRADADAVPTNGEAAIEVFSGFDAVREQIAA